MQVGNHTTDEELLQNYWDEYLALKKSRAVNISEKNPEGTFPTPSSPEEALELMYNYYGPLYLLALKRAFVFDNRDGWSEIAIKAELMVIEQFVNECNDNEISWFKAAKDWAKGQCNIHYQSPQEDKFRYILIKNNWLKNLDYDHESTGLNNLKYMISQNSYFVQVYARYFLFYEFLKSQLKKENETNKPKQKVIALKHYYLFEASIDVGITEENRDEIARKYGWSSANSGVKIHQIYQGYLNQHARTGGGDNFTNLQAKNNQLKIFDLVIQELHGFPQAQRLCIDEREVFRRNNLL